MDEEGYNKRLENLTNILSGDTTIDLHLQFLIRNNHTDLNILKKTKDTVRVSVCHSATVIAHGLMNAGTTSDSFLRDNLDWLSRATNWAKLTATASLGAIHRGHEKDAKTLMSSYLPKDSGLGGAGYTEGGALYALGLIHANHGSGIVDYLLSQLKDAPNEMSLLLRVLHAASVTIATLASGVIIADRMHKHFKKPEAKDQPLYNENVLIKNVYVGSTPPPTPSESDKTPSQ